MVHTTTNLLVGEVSELKLTGTPTLFILKFDTNILV